MNLIWININGVDVVLNLEFIREYRKWEDGTLTITWQNGDTQRFVDEKMVNLVYEKIKNISIFHVP
jgi:uncharacterized protein YlzI (FlbEa/FlbD family)